MKILISKARLGLRTVLSRLPDLTFTPPCHMFFCLILFALLFLSLFSDRAVERAKSLSLLSVPRSIKWELNTIYLTVLQEQSASGKGAQETAATDYHLISSFEEITGFSLPCIGNTGGWGGGGEYYLHMCVSPVLKHLRSIVLC